MDWIGIYVKSEAAAYFDGFGAEHDSKWDQQTHR